MRLLITLFVGLPLAALARPSSTGTWEASHGSVSAFSLVLTQHGQEIRGYHTAVAHGGKRLDAADSPNDPPSIFGSTTGPVAHVHFTSSFGGEGDATMVVRGDTLRWHVVSSQGAHYFPSSELLRRDISRHAKTPNQAMQRTAGRAAF